MKTLALILFVPLLAGAQNAPAPAGKLTLKQAVDTALSPQGSTRVQLAGEAVEQSKARSGQARGALLPNLDSSLSHQSQTRNLRAFGFEIASPIPGIAIPSFVGPFTTMDARLTANQSLFDFSAIRRYQAARTGVRAAEADSGSARDQVSAQVASQYMVAVAAQANVEAAEANVALSQALADLAENRRKAGTGTGIEVTRAQVQLANDRQRLLVAQNDRRRAHLQLRRAMGVSLDGEFELAETLTYRPAEPMTPQQAIEAAVKSRADLKAQQRREETARLNYSAVKWERLPSVGGFGDYGAIGPGLGNAVPTRTYGVSLRLPVFDGGRRDARRSEGASQLRQEEIRGRDLRAQAELEVRLAVDDLRSADDQFKVAEEGLAQAQRETEQARRRYEAGVASSIEPTDAQTRLARARDNRIAALLNYNLARINLAQAMGVISQFIQ